MEIDINKIEALPDYNPLDYIKSESDAKAYLKEALEDGDAKLILASLKDVMKFYGMTKIANKTGLDRSNLYKIMSGKTEPQFSTIMKIVNSLGLTVTLK